jgi:hypothetical protein
MKLFSDLLRAVKNLRRLGAVVSHRSVCRIALDAIPGHLHHSDRGKPAAQPAKRRAQRDDVARRRREHHPSLLRRSARSWALRVFQRAISSFWRA